MLSAKKGKISFGPKLLGLWKNFFELTVCKSRLNKIKAINPEPIASGASDTNASSFPYKSPVSLINKWENTFSFLLSEFCLDFSFVIIYLLDIPRALTLAAAIHYCCTPY